MAYAGLARSRSGFCFGLLSLCAFATVQAPGQQGSGMSSGPVIVQPGAPGQDNKTLTPANARGEKRPPSPADIEFMQGMIMHHHQAVEMTELLKTRSQDPEVRDLGKKIDVSQTDEMRWMKQWLTDRGLPITAPMPGMDMSGMDMSGMDMSGMDMSSMMPPMPGMLTKAQMDALRKASGAEFDHLFLTGMIQHHTGALTMVKQLFQNPGAGQDPQLFDFASDVDNTQQAEIDIMRHMLRRGNERQSNFVSRRWRRVTGARGLRSRSGTQQGTNGHERPRDGKEGLFRFVRICEPAIRP